MQLDRLPVALLVEDDASRRATIAHLLHGEGFEVREASDGDQGLALARLTSPDVIVLDLRLPRHAALTLLQGLRLAQHSRDIVVHFARAYAVLMLSRVWIVDREAHVPSDFQELLARVSQTEQENGTGCATRSSE